MKKIFVRDKTNGEIKGPIEIGVKNLIAIFNMQNIKIYDYEKNIAVYYMNGLYKGRIANFDHEWETMVTEIPDSVGITFVNMKIKKEDYEDYFIDWQRVPDVFGE